MRVQEFLRQIPELVRTQLPPDLREFRVAGPVASLIKLHYGNPRIHYEVWIQRRTGRVEIGLHFEDDAETNARYLESLSSRFVEIQSALGPGVEPEQWTSTWTRIHQGLPLGPLEEDLLPEVSSCMCQMVQVLEPMVREVSKRMVTSKEA